MQELLHNPWFFYSVVLATAIMSAAIGTGTGFILIPLAAIYFGSKESIGILTIFFLCQNSTKILFFWKHIKVKLGVQLIIYAIPGAVLGGIALSYIPLDLFKKILAALVLVYLANEMFGLLPKNDKPNKYVLPIFGVFYGFLSGLMSTGNLIKGPLFTGMGMLKETYIGTYAFTSFFVNIPKLATYYATGTIDLYSFVKAWPFLVLSIVGTWIGRQFLRSIPQHVFRWILNISFALSAVALFFD